MSNILTKTVKKVNILSVIIALVLAAAIAVGIVCGLQGWGVFNKDALLKDSNTLTVSVNQFVYQSDLEKVESECEAVLGEYGISYEMKGQMSGDDSEIVYVFANDVDLTAAKAALETKFASLTAPDGALEGASVTVAANSEAAVGVLAEGYVLRGIIAGVVLAALVFAYVAIRYGLFMGIVATVSTVLGTLLTTALFILTRIPVTASVIYVIAVGALLTAVMTVISLGKIRENAKVAEGQTAEEVIASSYATKEILLLTALMGGALVIMGAVATGAGVRWFALLSLVALLVAACIGLVYAPALYLPFKKIVDNKPVEGAYVGAEKTSTKVKKVFEKKVAVKEVKAAPVEEAPVEETPVEEPETEEVAEETVEEETVETEEVAEEATEEVAEEAPVEAIEETEEKQE